MATKKVKNVANSGVRQTATMTTGATGSVTNTVRATSVQGAAGAPGSSGVNIVSPGRPGMAQGQAPDYDSVVQGHVATANIMARERTDAAFAQAEGHLASARQTALGAVPAEYRDLVTQRFAQASAQIEEQRQRIRARLG